MQKKVRFIHLFLVKFLANDDYQTVFHLHRIGQTTMTQEMLAIIPLIQNPIYFPPDIFL